MQQENIEQLAWTQEQQSDSLVIGPGEDDFTRFLELGSEFTGFEGIDQHNIQSGLDTPMGRLTFGMGTGLVQQFTPQPQAMLQNMDMNMESAPQQLIYQQMRQNQQQNMQFQVPMTNGQHFASYPLHQPVTHTQQYIPLTPVSGEIQQSVKYGLGLENAGQMIFERQNASFTPLVSPAQTPLENAWMPDYVVSEEFFSPLTSPAIEAQNSYTHTTNSSIDLNIDLTTSGGSSSVLRKSRRKANPSARAAAARNIRSTPSMKSLGTKRRQPSEGSPTNAHTTLVIQHTPVAQTLASYSITTSSEDSLSPEPLSAISMRPPPIPAPRMANGSTSHQNGDSSPATPATLMRIPGKDGNIHSADVQMVGSPEAIDEILLPAAAAKMPPPVSAVRILPDVSTQIESDSHEIPSGVSSKTPKLSAGSTPRSLGVRTANQSLENLSKPNRGGRQSKKRQSIGSAAISPALRPKISPSISPLVPSTAAGLPVLSAETSALFLASKSNYQNIIDGTHLPGVSYPDTLAENLSSKRTSHKIAEQGRRNRINVALKEIESLLPPALTANMRRDKNAIKEENGDDSKGGGGQGASKASTVEMAIVYIKSLQAELQSTKDKLEVADKLLAEGVSSVGSQASDQSTT